ncbi:MAG: hypothetical protein GX257_08240 [Clostridiales bacterium]|jgi:hypothetical protein|nr:hypothetical protein [Clostridiales bacterium]
MDLINKNVQHEVFGKGTICELTDEVISVKFESGVKKFVFPDAFRDFLVMTEKKSEQYISEMLDDIDKEMKLKKEQEVLEAERRERLANLPINTKAQTAFGFIENDRERVLEDGEVFVGTYRSGQNRGKPRSTSRIYPNSACLLTYLEEGQSEEERVIWGVFMVRDDYIGSEFSDGMIPVHEKYRILLDDEQKKFHYWDYFMDNSKSKTPKWGTVEIKYFDNMTMLKILTDISENIEDQERKKLFNELIEYYCRINKITVD